MKTLHRILGGAVLVLLSVTPAEATWRLHGPAPETVVVEKRTYLLLQEKAAMTVAVKAENANLHGQVAGLTAQLAHQAQERADDRANFDRQLLALRAELDGKGVRIAALEVDLTVEKRDNARLHQQNQVFIARIRESRPGDDGSVPQTPARRPTPPQSDDDF